MTNHWFLKDVQHIYFSIKNFIIDFRSIFQDNHYNFDGLYVKEKLPKTIGTKIKNDKFL